MNKEYTDKLNKIIKDKKLSFYDLEKITGYSSGAIFEMIKGKRSFPKHIIKKLSPVLGISKNELESWIVIDKYPKNIIEKAIESIKTRKDKKSSVFSQNINKLLSENKLSESALAKAIVYDQPSINKMIAGKKAVSKTVVTKLSNFFQIAEEDIEAWILADKYSLKVLELALKII